MDKVIECILQKAGSKKNGALDATVLRTRSLNARDIIAWAASGGRLKSAELLRTLEHYRDEELRNDARVILEGLDPQLAGRFARILLLQDILPDDRLHGLTLIEALLAIWGKGSLDRKLGKLGAEVLVHQGEFERAQAYIQRVRINKSDRERLYCDLMNPFVGGTSGEEQWLERFNSLYFPDGYRGIALRAQPSGTAVAPFDRLCYEGFCDEVAGPLVTVIVTSWKPDLALLVAVESILGQSWSNLEVIVVDDASPAEHDEILERCRRLSPKVRVVKREINEGTYCARNVAMREARGEYVTFQDSDDWSHPRRIEEQVRVLNAHPAAVATRSRSLRVSEAMVCTVPGSATIQGNASSLLFVRELVMSRIGYFDRVRKAADTEYALRIARAFPGGLVEMEGPPLALIRLNRNSLSRAEFRPGWRHPSRKAYRNAYELWHAEIGGENSLGSAYLPFEGREVRPFPAPRRFQVTPEINNHYDVVLVGDWRSYGGPQKSMIEEIKALVQSGLRVAICHLEALRFMTSSIQPLCREIQVLINAGTVDEVNTDDDLYVSVVILRYPLILQFCQDSPARWRAGAGIIVANQAPHEHDGSDLRYCVTDCIRNFRHMFGCDARWAPQGPQVRDAIRNLVPPALLLHENVPGIINPEDWVTPCHVPCGPKPVIGRYSRDNLLKFPSRKEDLLAAYPDDPGVVVKIMGGEVSCEQLLGGDAPPENWMLHKYGEIPVLDFLSQIDFFVYYDSDDIVEAFGRSILEAIAAGVIVILPPKFEVVFGEGAVYAEPFEVRDLVKRIHADPYEYARLTTKALERVSREFSYACYVKKVQRWIRA